MQLLPHPIFSSATASVVYQRRHACCAENPGFYGGLFMKRSYTHKALPLEPSANNNHLLIFAFRRHGNGMRKIVKGRKRRYRVIIICAAAVPHHHDIHLRISNEWECAQIAQIFFFFPNDRHFIIITRIMMAVQFPEVYSRGSSHLAMDHKRIWNGSLA